MHEHADMAVRAPVSVLPLANRGDGRMDVMKRPLFFLLASLAPWLCFAAESIPTLPLGSAAPDFNLPGVDGRNWALKDFAGAKVLVVVFTCNHCPTAQYYEDRLKAIVSGLQKQRRRARRHHAERSEIHPAR